MLDFMCWLCLQNLDVNLAVNNLLSRDDEGDDADDDANDPYMSSGGGFLSRNTHEKVWQCLNSFLIRGACVAQR